MSKHKHPPGGFSVFEKQINELIQHSSSLPLPDIMNLLMRADAHPNLDIEKELKRLQEKYATKPANVCDYDS